jgi:hypothetical protein
MPKSYYAIDCSYFVDNDQCAKRAGGFIISNAKRAIRGAVLVCEFSDHRVGRTGRVLSRFGKADEPWGP